MKKYIFKNQKYSVKMTLVQVNEDGSWKLEHETYKGLFYNVKNPKDELEEVKD